MTMYDVMYEAINEQYENGEITFEQAEELNELAYDKYIIETSRETKEKRDRLYYGMQSDGNSNKAPIINSKSNHVYDRSKEYDYERKRQEEKYINAGHKEFDNGYHKMAVRKLKKWDDIESDRYWNQYKGSDGKEIPALRKYTTTSGDTHIAYRTKTPQKDVNPKRIEKMNKLAKVREYNNDAEHSNRKGYFGDSASGGPLSMDFYYKKPTEEEKAAREDRKEALRNLNDTKPKSMLKKKK